MSNENLTNPTTEEMAREVWERLTGKKALRRVTIACETEIVDDSSGLATSLNDWHEHIFPVMSDEQKDRHDNEIRIMAKRGMFYEFEATAMHHLTAAYNMIKGGK